jgi:energy-coupling factor transporter ATP-binding protein EcfA2
MAERASVPMTDFKNEYQIRNHNDDDDDNGDDNDDYSASKRKEEAEKRKVWEDQRSSSVVGKNTGGGGGGGESKKNFPGNIAGTKVTGRTTTNPYTLREDKNLNPQKIEDFAKSKKSLEEALSKDKHNVSGSKDPTNIPNGSNGGDEMALAEAKSSEIVARAGSGTAFEGGTLGIGGLDEVLAQVKRRVWVPLAAPPSLLRELGINPVRGLLLYGMPGCGKTLLARSLGKILSPARPITVVSGPEIMDKFVGSSEANLRAIFDNPPEIYDSYRIGTKDNGAALEKVALHVIVLDEFDAMARTRGGSRGGGDQGDAGVARDSVVNQLLAKMDGVDPLVVPTLVIGMTNRRSLIEPALLRPGRFEVQIEVPRPKTVAQRVSILNVHMKNMFQAGRLLVSDAPDGTVAFKRVQKQQDGNDVPPAYHELLDYIAVKCEGMSGASLAGVARAAASRALERAVCDFAGHVGQDANDNNVQEGYSIADCLVTKADFESAIEDVLESSRGGDGGEDEEEKEDQNITEESNNAT